MIIGKHPEVHERQSSINPCTLLQIRCHKLNFSSVARKACMLLALGNFVSMKGI